MSSRTFNVASSATSVEIFASNPGRRGGAIYNDSTQILTIVFGTSDASATNLTTTLAANGGYFELPPSFQGAVQGIWASANGAARCTEW